MNARKAVTLFVILNTLYFSAIAALMFWAGTKFYGFAIYQGWIRP